MLLAKDGKKYGKKYGTYYGGGKQHQRNGHVPSFTVNVALLQLDRVYTDTEMRTPLTWSMGLVVEWLNDQAGYMWNLEKQGMARYAVGAHLLLTDCRLGDVGPIRLSIQTDEIIAGCNFADTCLPVPDAWRDVITVQDIPDGVTTHAQPQDLFQHIAMIQCVQR